MAKVKKSAQKNKGMVVTVKEDVDIPVKVTLEQWNTAFLEELYEYAKLLEKEDQKKYGNPSKYKSFASWHHNNYNFLEEIKQVKATFTINITSDKKVLAREVEKIKQTAMRLTPLFTGNFQITDTGKQVKSLTKQRKIYKLKQLKYKNDQIAKELKLFKGSAKVDNKDIKVTQSQVIKWKKGTSGRGNKDNIVHGYFLDNACSLRYESVINKDIGRDVKECKKRIANLKKGIFP